MGDLMPGIPSVPGDETSWANFVDQFETLKRGDMPLSLTNWDDLDLVPSIAAGAGIEIAGATYRFTAESLISDESGLIAGAVYVVIKTADPTVNEATAYFSNVAPTWRDDLNGWYDTTGANRYTGHVMDWDGAAAYISKRYLPAKSLGYSLDGGINTDNVFVKSRKYTGVYSGDSVTFPHGLNSDKILSATVAFWLPSTSRWATDGAGGTIWWDASSVFHHQDSIGSPSGTAYKAIVLYEV